MIKVCPKVKLYQPCNHLGLCHQLAKPGSIAACKEFLEFFLVQHGSQGRIALLQAVCEHLLYNLQVFRILRLWVRTFFAVENFVGEVVRHGISQKRFFHSLLKLDFPGHVENVFQNRFRYTEELMRLGARIHTEGRVAVVTGVTELHGAPTVATDLRGGAALIIAGLSAEGVTEILDSGHIERGYEDLDSRLRELGAEIERSA